VPGIEYSDPGDVVHVPVWGASRYLGTGLETHRLLAAASDSGGAAVLAHPRRRGAHARYAPSWASELLGVEVWNRKYDGYAPNRWAVELQRKERRLVPFMTLDFHSARQFFPAWSELEIAGGLDEGSVFAALRARRIRPIALGVDGTRVTSDASMARLEVLERGRRRLAPLLSGR
jgi:hypothetical protein